MQEINLRSGYAFTRFQTNLLSNAYKIHNVLSYGMWQNQVWNIKCTHKTVDGTTKFSMDVSDSQETTSIYNSCIQNSRARVSV
ncbi:putative DNA topoisomerase [Helianthus anomalus]